LKKDLPVFVAASTQCWPELDLPDCIGRLRDLDFASIEIAIHESGNVKPSELVADTDRATQILRMGHRLDISGYSVELASTGAQHYEEFEKICYIAKNTKVVNITVPSGEHGTPFNEEVERPFGAGLLERRPRHVDGPVQ
jgi:hypothetical protein